MSDAATESESHPSSPVSIRSKLLKLGVDIDDNSNSDSNYAPDVESEQESVVSGSKTKRRKQRTLSRRLPLLAGLPAVLLPVAGIDLVDRPQLDNDVNVSGSITIHMDSDSVIPRQLVSGFSSYSEFRVALDKFCTDTMQPMQLMSSKKLLKVEIYRELAAVFKYEYFTVRCSRSGDARETVTQSDRKRECLTKKHKCRASMSVKFDKSGKRLVVTQANLQHNHDLTLKMLYAVCPGLRRVAAQKTISDSYELQHSPAKIARHVRSIHGFVMTNQDVKNAIQHLPQVAAKRVYVNNTDIFTRLDDVMEKWRNKNVQFLTHVSEQNELQSVAIVSTEMKSTWDKYHSLLLVDGTYRMNKQDYHLFSVITIDRHGCGFPVGMAFVCNETSSVLTAALQQIETMLDGDFGEVQRILTDKDWSQLNSFQVVFPSARVYLCSWHVDQIFWRLTRQLKKTDCGQKSKEEVYLLARQLIYAPTEEAFDVTLATLKHRTRNVASSIMDDIQRRWIPIKEQWAQCFRVGDRNLWEHSNSKVERHNAQAKTYVLGPKGGRRIRPSLPEAIDRLLTGLESAAAVRSLETSYKEVKSPMLKGLHGESILKVVHENVSVRAFSLIMKQVRRRALDKQGVSEIIPEQMYSICDGTNERQYQVRTDTGSCSCLWQKSFGLPCPHVLSVFHANNATLVHLPHFIDNLFTRGNQSANMYTAYPMNDDFESDGETHCTRAQRQPNKKREKRYAELWNDGKVITNEFLNTVSHTPELYVSYMRLCERATIACRNEIPVAAFLNDMLSEMNNNSENPESDPQCAVTVPASVERCDLPQPSRVRPAMKLVRTKPPGRPKNTTNHNKRNWARPSQLISQFLGDQSHAALQSSDNIRSESRARSHSHSHSPNASSTVHQHFPQLDDEIENRGKYLLAIFASSELLRKDFSFCVPTNNDGLVFRFSNFSGSTNTKNGHPFAAKSSSVRQQ